MNGISTDVLAGLAGVTLGAVICLVGVWIEGRRETRRIPDQRRCERAKDRVDKIEPYTGRLHHLSNEIRHSVQGVFRWVRYWAHVPPSERPGTPQGLFDALERALEKADAVLDQDLRIILDSLEPQILDGFDELRKSFNTLCLLASAFLLEKETAFAPQDIAGYIES